MSFFIQESKTELDALTDPDLLMSTAPEYYRPRFEAIKELREMDDGSLHRGNEWRRVASLVNVPMMTALKIADPEFMMNKKRFYAWLARNPQYKTYDQRGGSRPTVTVVDGKEI